MSDAEETQRLLSGAANHAEGSRGPVSSKEKEKEKESRILDEKCAAGSSASPLPSSEKDIALCRICLEEDATNNLEQPCGCMGTQKYAHHACIQRWVEEKGNLKCEICEQTYKGEYTVPASTNIDTLPLMTPVFIRLQNQDNGHDSTLDLLDEHDQYHMRHSGLSWCFTFILFVMFLVVLHHTMVVTGGDGGDGSGGGGSDTTDSDGYATSLAIFLFWVLTKALLIGIPLYTVMKIAARQARREQYEAMYRAGAEETAAGRRLVVRARILRPATDDDVETGTSNQRTIVA